MGVHVGSFLASPNVSYPNGPFAVYGGVYVVKPLFTSRVYLVLVRAKVLFGNKVT